MKNFMKIFLLSIFCPILFLVNSNGISNLKGGKLLFLKYFIAVLVTAIVVVFVYYLNKEII